MKKGALLVGVILGWALVGSAPTATLILPSVPPVRAAPVTRPVQPISPPRTPPLPPAPPLPTLTGREVVVGSGGLLGQWLVMGPLLAPPQPHTLLHVVPGQPVPLGAGRARFTARWRLLLGRSAKINLRRIFRLRKKQSPRYALLGLTLRATRAQTVHLQIGHDDGLALYWNGRLLQSVAAPHRYEPDHRLVVLSARQGLNHLVLVTHWQKGPWRVRARLTGVDHRALGTGRSRGQVRVEVPDGLAPVTARWLRGTRSGLAGLRMGLRRRVSRAGLRYRLRLTAPAGLVLPTGSSGAVRVTVRDNGVGRPRPQTVDLRQVAAGGVELDLGPATPRVRSATVAVASWGRRRLWQPRASGLCRRLLRADADLAAAQSSSTLPQSSRDTVAYHLADLRRLLLRGDNDWSYLRRRLGVVARWARALRSGRDPFPKLRGRLVKAYRSRLDGSLQPYSLYVPAGYGRRRNRGRKWPLYVMLHGITSTHRKGVNQMLGVWKPLTDRTPWWKFLRRPGPARLHPQALVVAPQAFGPAMYWHMGEVDVYRVIAEVKRRYRVDPRRVVLVGHSMGGTGVLDVGLHRPHDFAGMVSIAGYPSRWIHNEVSRSTLLPWERLQAQRYSPVFWADNGRHLGLIAVHGTADGPEKSRMIVSAFRKRGFAARLKIHRFGHAVYRLYLDKGQVYRDTRRWQTPAAPRRVTFRTTRLRWNRAHWIRIDRRPLAQQWSVVDGRLQGSRTITVTTKNVSGLSLLLDPAVLPAVSAGTSLSVTLDGQSLTVRRRPVLRFQRVGLRWRSGAASTRRGVYKRPGLEGPMEDLHYGPVLVVYGTRDPLQTAALRRVARRLRRFRWGTVRYPMKADTAVTAADRRRHHLLLVGGPHANAETARYAKRLPIRVTRTDVRVGRKRFRGADLGVRFIVPNPDATDRYLLVVAGTTAQGVLRQHLLPWYLPDYVVYDRTLETQRGFRVLGPGRRYLAAGFFDRRWRLR